LTNGSLLTQALDLCTSSGVHSLVIPASLQLLCAVRQRSLVDMAQVCLSSLNILYVFSVALAWVGDGLLGKESGSDDGRDDAGLHDD